MRDLVTDPLEGAVDEICISTIPAVEAAGEFEDLRRSCLDDSVTA